MHHHMSVAQQRNFRTLGTSLLNTANVGGNIIITIITDIIINVNKSNNKNTNSTQIETTTKQRKQYKTNDDKDF